MRRSVVAVGIGAAAALAAVVASRRRRPTGGQRPAIRHTNRVDRNAELARVSTRLGASYAANRARRVFASAARKEELDTALELRTAEEVAAALGSMKGALMKIGQMASFLDDGLPEPLRDALAQLQQDAPPMSGDLAAEVVERELGTGPDTVFAEWDPVPIAAASIGQVHRAVTRDDRAVAVKVQYPDVDKAILADLDNSEVLFGFLGMVFPGLEPGPVVDEIRARISEELDYRAEGASQQRFADFYRGHPFIHVPGVLAGLSTGKVLTTELASGARFSELSEWSQDERNLAAEAIYRFVFRSLYRMHAFNGDPHPGNYLFRPGGRVTFLDFGLVRYFDNDEINLFERMALSLVVRRDFAEYRATIEEAGILKRGAPFTDEQVVDYFGHFYELIRQRGVQTVTHDYAAETVRRIFDMRSQHSEVPKWSNVPPTLVVIQRINLGLFAILAELGATADWLSISKELWPSVDAPASTPLGRDEERWLAARPPVGATDRS